MKLELETDEVKTIIEILRYSVDNCPVESTFIDAVVRHHICLPRY